MGQAGGRRARALGVVPRNQHARTEQPWTAVSPHLLMTVVERALCCVPLPPPGQPLSSERMPEGRGALCCCLVWQPGTQHPEQAEYHASLGEGVSADP